MRLNTAKYWLIIVILLVTAGLQLPLPSHAFPTVFSHQESGYSHLYHGKYFHQQHTADCPEYWTADIETELDEDDVNHTNDREFTLEPGLAVFALSQPAQFFNVTVFQSFQDKRRLPVLSQLYFLYSSLLI